MGDAFEWARAAMGNDHRLLLNELTGQMAGLPIPTNDDVLAAVKELKSRGAHPDGLGPQAHFAPIQAHFGAVLETDFRVPLDKYARTLDTIASGTALPLYVSELSIASPTEPELRAAGFEGLLRLYFGHPAVEEVMFWGFWSRKHFLSGHDAGIWSHDRSLTRHGEAVLALLNDRWRTRRPDRIHRALPAKPPIPELSDKGGYRKDLESVFSRSLLGLSTHHDPATRSCIRSQEYAAVTLFAQSRRPLPVPGRRGTLGRVYAVGVVARGFEFTSNTPANESRYAHARNS